MNMMNLVVLLKEIWITTEFGAQRNVFQLDQE